MAREPSTLRTPSSLTNLATEAGPAPRLLVTAGPDRGRAFAAKNGRAVVGTHPSCDVVLSDGTVSRFHFELVLADGRVVLRDLGSSNGTALDGVAVASAFPRDGATIRAGETELVLELGVASSAPLSTRDRFGGLVGTSPAMRRLFAVLENVAPASATVLLLGETGTGKEAVAEAIHQESRRGKPFVVVDCGAIPAELIESELFGHERGAFTGATATKDGAFQAAAGGTIFLDEIGELPLELQPKLLRALERREVKRVGSTRHLPVDVRVIAATNRDLRADVNAGRFRSDLFYRLAVVEVRLPPLRERPSDIPLLVEHIARQLRVDEVGLAALRAEPFLARLTASSWPGNVRELRNAVERYLAVRELRVSAEPAGAEGPPAVDVRRPLKEARDEWTAWFERRYVEELLAAHEGNKAVAARAAGIDRVTFYRLLWRLGLGR
jgi:DNA-binding NtrC family response regulator